MNRSVAIVGRPNVGKSRLFNRLARKRISIVHDQPGVTRDVISAEIEDGAYTLLDTGGLGFTDGNITPAALTAASEQQVGFAMDAAALILFVIDGLEGLTSLDTRIAQMLRKSKKNVLLVINKADFDDAKIDLAEAYRLGLGEPIRVSAEHGTGESFLREEILKRIGPAPEVAEPGEKTAADPLCVCFIGRPNVGKSSLSNRLLRSDRLIVSEVAGTTRDAIELPFDFKGRDGKFYPFKLIDTAGIKASTKLASPVEYFSRLRSLDAIKETDVVFLVLDAIDGVTQQDKAIAGEAIKERKPIVIVVNKWDVVKQAFASKLDPDCAPEWGLHDFKSEREYRLKYERAILDRLFFTPGAPLIFVSAMSGYEVDRMLNAAVKLNRILDIKLSTAKLNKVIGYLTERTPPPSVGGKRFRVYYATQTGNRPFRIKIFCNREEKLTEQYRRYLEAGLVDAFELNGCPIYFELVGKEKHEPGTAYSGKAKRAALENARREHPEAHVPKWKEGEDAAADEDSTHETLED
ncbi:MAG: ribosome biogenesis GTPase Der [Verrucomicrobia bacterium]|nr:ribosome biogenesis GTPase Der [Verrucomicrobiota bacterium]